MFAWLKELLGRGADKRPLSSNQIQDALSKSERIPMGEIDTGMALLRMLEADPSLTEQTLAESIGRDVKYVKRAVNAARASR